MSMSESLRARAETTIKDEKAAHIEDGIDCMYFSILHLLRYFYENSCLRATLSNHHPDTSPLE